MSAYPAARLFSSLLSFTIALGAMAPDAHASVTGLCPFPTPTPTPTPVPTPGPTPSPTPRPTPWPTPTPTPKPVPTPTPTPGPTPKPVPTPTPGPTPTPVPTPTPGPTPTPQPWAPDTRIVTAPPKLAGASASFSFCTTHVNVRYQCRLDGGPFIDCPVVTHIDGLSEGLHQLEVRAYTVHDGAADPTPATYEWYVDVTAPTPVITQGPDARTAQMTATFTFISSEPTDTLACALDDEPFERCTSPVTITLTPPADGAHVFRVQSRDLAGNTAVAAWPWQVDTTAPEVIFDDALPQWTNQETVSLAFTCTEDDCLFECSTNGEAFATCTSPAEVTVSGEGAHVFEVRATDALGHVQQTPSRHEWTLDTTPPDTLLVSGPDEVVSESPVSIAFESDEPGATFICATEAEPLGVPCTSPWLLHGLSLDDYLVTVTAVDRAGNVDPEPLEIAFRYTDDLDGDGLPDAFETLLGTDPRNPDTDGDGLPDGLEVLTHTDPLDDDTDDDGLLDGEEDANANGQVDEGETDPRNPDTDGDGLTDGLELGLTMPQGNDTDPAKFRADADPATTTDPTLADTDGGGAVDGDEDANRNGRVDAGERDPLEAGDDADTPSPAPLAILDEVAAAWTQNETVSFAFSCTEDDCRFECSVDDAAFEACTSPATVTVSGEGEHRFEVRALDARNRPQATPASHVWTLDRTPPDTLLVSGPDEVVSKHTVLVSFAANEDGATFLCASDIESAGEPCTSPWVLHSLTPGDHTVSVTAVDRAGNLDPEPLVIAFRYTDDFDGDGLSDELEALLGTDPKNADTDGDGLPDGLEVRTGTNPLDDDTDDDGLLDGAEDANANGVVDEGETDPRRADTDEDGLPDGLERGLTEPQGKHTDPTKFRADADPTTTTDPTRADTDGGGVFDGYEDANRNGRVDEGETDPLEAGDDEDADGDGIDNATELAFGLDPFDADTDDDGVTDGLDGLNDTDRDGVIDALDPDSDGDGLPDGLEMGVTAETAHPDTDQTSPNFRADADPTTKTDRYKADTDGDGLSDGEEDRNGNGRVDEGETDPLKADTDGDGVSDGAESQVGRNPLDPNDGQSPPAPDDGGCATAGLGLLPALGIAWLLRRRRI